MILRNLLDKVVAFAAWLRRKQVVHPDERVVKLNIGCGLAVAPGWINMDVSLNSFVAGWPLLHRLFYSFSGARRYYSLETYTALLTGGRFVHHNVKHGLPFPDGSLDFVYSSHFVEHLYKADADQLFQETFRALKPGGIVRVCIPDLAFAVELYHRGEKERMLEKYFFIDASEGFFAQHKYMYDFELLNRLLESKGFERVQKVTYRAGATPDLEILDNRPEETLFVEAKKPLLAKHAEGVQSQMAALA